jgi:predicted phosphodiesterase
MQRKNTAVLVTLLALLFFIIPFANAEVTVSAPENVILSLTGDTTEMGVTWRDVAEVAVGQVRYGRTENFSSSAVARRTLASGYNSFEAVMTGLIPGETYYYTVGSAAAWSEMQSFVAPEGDTNSFSFLYLGDVQYNLSLDEYQDWGQLMANAYENYGDVAFAIMCGDMVNNGQSAGQWQAFLAQATPVFSKIPMMAVPGNHESNDIKTGKPTLMNKLLSLPQNGLSGFEEEFYSFNYGDCHILCLNSNVYLNEQLQAGTMTPDDFDRIKTWIASDLSSSSAAWKIVVMHHPAYSVVSDKAGAAVLENWVPLFETAEVDLVLYGHQHIYMRTKPIWEGQIDYEKGITYLMSNSGSKHYPGVQTDYHAVLIENIPTYQVVTMNGDTLWLGTFSVDGEELDSCNLSARARTPQGDENGDGTVTQDECFIATAVYGSKFEPAVILLRAFRDKFLLTNVPGRAFVDFYYQNSPPVASNIANCRFLKAGVRALLTPVVGVVYLIFHPVLMFGMIGLLVFGIVIYRLQKRRLRSC